MAKVAIITDSTAYLPVSYLLQYQIDVLPLKVILDEESYDDGVDLAPRDFYHRLPASTTLPTTSQVTVGEFTALFEKRLAEGKDILAILLSSGMSGTIDSTVQAQSMFPGEKIEVLDSLSTTLQLGFMVLKGARCALDGGDLMACKKVVETAQGNSGVVFAVDTLEYLHRGGRIGGGKRFMGTVLNIKPILTVYDGKVEALEQSRTRRKSLKRMVEIVAERTSGKANVQIGISHANASEDAAKIMALAKEILDPVEILLTELSPVLGTHAGPGAIAMAYHFDE